MSIAISPSQNSELYLNSLKSSVTSQKVPLEMMVIAHDDDIMNERLSAVIDHESSALLAVPQTTWNLDGTEMTGAIEWAINEQELQQLVLVGHSQVSLASGTSPSRHATLRTNCGEKETRSSYDSLLRGAKRVSERMESSKRHFVDQLARLCGIPSVASAIEERQLQVHALFYVAEAGTFLAFDFETSQFRPLFRD